MCAARDPTHKIMLAWMPQSPHCLTDHHHTSATTTSAMSLAILPSSPATYSQPPLLSSKPSPSKRPKLSLNTSISPPTFGKKATSLRLETLSATSPTIRNTFSNAHEEESKLKGNGSKPKRPTLSNLSTSNIISCDNLSPSPSTSDHLDATSSSSTSTSANSISTTDSIPASVPYKLAYNATSILSNSPLPRSSSQRRTFAQTRPMFPVTKKVAFRAPLTEDITTEKFTMRHSDIESSNSTISTLELSPPEAESEGEATSKVADAKSEGDALKSQAKAAKQKSAPSPRAGDKRDSSDEEDSDTCPATPVAGRKKRHREWVWTLGPIDSANASDEGKRAEDANSRGSEGA